MMLLLIWCYYCYYWYDAITDIIAINYMMLLIAIIDAMSASPLTIHSNSSPCSSRVNHFLSIFPRELGLPIHPARTCSPHSSRANHISHSSRANLILPTFPRKPRSSRHSRAIPRIRISHILVTWPVHMAYLRWRHLIYTGLLNSRFYHKDI